MLPFSSAMKTVENGIARESKGGEGVGGSRVFKVVRGEVREGVARAPGVIKGIKEKVLRERRRAAGASGALRVAGATNGIHTSSWSWSPGG